MSVYSTALLTAASAWLPFFSILLPLLLLPLFFLNKNKNNPPSPPFKLPFIGHLHHIGRLPHRSLWRLSQKHGPIMLLQLGKVPTVIVSSAQMACEVLKTHDLELATRPPLIAFKKLSYNFVDVAFAPYGDYWREMRKVSIVELFSVKRVQSFAHVRAEEVESMVQFTRDHSNKSDPSSATALGVDLSEMMTSLMYKMVCRVAFGRSYEAGSEQEKARFHGALLEAGAMLGGFFVGDFLPWLGWVDVFSGLRGRLERSFQALDAFYERLIEDHVDPKKGDEKKEEEDFVDVLLRVQKDMRLSRDNVKGVLMVIF